MERLVPLDLSMHLEDFVQLNVEYLSWMYGQLEDNYQIDAAFIIGLTPSEYVHSHLEELTSLNPPEGIIYLLVVGGEIAGMGAVRKLGDEVGEIKRMYTRRTFRGRGYGRRMLNRLLEAGREFGCSSFLLDSPRWSHAAHHIYRSTGFEERGEYPESEVPPVFRSYWLFMEKKG